MRIFIGGGGEHFGGSSVDFEANNGGTYFVVNLTIGRDLAPLADDAPFSRSSLRLKLMHRGALSSEWLSLAASLTEISLCLTS